MTLLFFYKNLCFVQMTSLGIRIAGGCFKYAFKMASGCVKYGFKASALFGIGGVWFLNQSLPDDNSMYKQISPTLSTTTFENYGVCRIAKSGSSYYCGYSNRWRMMDEKQIEAYQDFHGESGKRQTNGQPQTGFRRRLIALKSMIC